MKLFCSSLFENSPRIYSFETNRICRRQHSLSPSFEFSTRKKIGITLRFSSPPRFARSVSIVPRRGSLKEGVVIERKERERERSVFLPVARARGRSTPRQKFFEPGTTCPRKTRPACIDSGALPSSFVRLDFARLRNGNGSKSKSRFHSHPNFFLR